MGKHGKPAEPNPRGDAFDAQHNHSANTANQNGVKPVPEGKKQSGESHTDGSGPVTKVTGGNGKR